MLSHGASAEGARRPGSTFDESEAVRRAQLGSHGAFEELVVARGPSLHRFLVAKLRNESDARDALQETLVAAWQSLPRLRERDRFWPWLVGIAAHKAADVARRRVPLAEAQLEPATALAGDVHDATCVRELWTLIASLPSAQRDVLLLRYLLQLSEEEAADALGVRVGTVKSRTNRARAALRELIA